MPAAKPPAGPPAGPPVDEGGFLSRWSRRKALLRQGGVPAEPPAIADAAVATPPAALRPPGPASAPVNADRGNAPPAAPPAEPPPPLPTLADVATLQRDSDYTRFMAPGVDGAVKNAALRKLFTDPHFNVMDRLDTYIDDYGLPDPLPAGMLRQMAQSQFLGLFADEDAAEAAARAAPPELAADAPSPALPAAPADGPAIPTSPPATSAALSTSDLATPSAATPGPPPDENPDLRLQQDAAAGPPGADAGAGPDPGRQR